MKTKSILKLSAVLLLFSFLPGCSSSDDDKLSADFQVEDGIDRVYLNDTSISDGSATVSWSSDANLRIEKVADKRYCFLLPDRETTGNANVTMTVASGKNTDQVTKPVALPALELHRKYGLGISLAKEVSNDVSYEWYVDQNNTGTYRNINCGPACTEMVIRWADPASSVTTEELRDDSGQTGWWNTSTIQTYVRKAGVTCDIIDFQIFSNLRPELDAGHIAILCMDIYYVRESTVPEWRKDKYYSTSSSGSGHFIVVKGYKEVDGKYLLECYDPWSMGAKYEDGQYKGKDRYYRAEDIVQATSIWWKYALIVSEKEIEGRSAVRSSDFLLAPRLDPETVPLGYGG